MLLNGARVLLLHDFILSCFGGVDLISGQMDYGWKDCRCRATMHMIRPDDGAGMMQGNVGASPYVGVGRQAVPTGGRVSRTLSARPHTV
jgi:hypothetical protein